MGAGEYRRPFEPSGQRWSQWVARMETETEMTLVPDEMTLVPDEMTLVPEEMTALPPDGLPPPTARSSPFVNWRRVSFLSASLRDGEC
jgi:hypothetical protein